MTNVILGPCAYLGSASAVCRLPIGPLLHLSQTSANHLCLYLFTCPRPHAITPAIKKVQSFDYRYGEEQSMSQSQISEDTKYLFKRDKTWWVKLAVPRPLRGELGFDLRRSLHTDDVEAARQARWEAIEEFRTRFERVGPNKAVTPLLQSWIRSMMRTRAVAGAGWRSPGRPAYRRNRQRFRRRRTEVWPGPGAGEREDGQWRLDR